MIHLHEASHPRPDRVEMFIQTMGHSKGLPPLEQTTYNTARQHNTHCFQQELPTSLLTQLCLGFHLMLSKMVKPAMGEFSYALLNILKTWVRVKHKNNDPDSKLREIKRHSSMKWYTGKTVVVTFATWNHFYLNTSKVSPKFKWLI